MKFEIDDKAYIEVVHNIQSIFKETTHTLFDGRNVLKVLDYKDKKLVVKSFKIPHMINKIAYTFFRDSKAKKSYLNSLKIKEFVPKPIAYIEFFRAGLLYDSYFICEEFRYDFTIRDVLLDAHYPDKAGIFKAFAKFSHDLHEKNIEHIDYSPGNILIQKSIEGYVFKIIDVNRMKFRQLSSKERLENFSKLWAKDEDLREIIGAYADYIDIPKEEAIEIALGASQAHKDKKGLTSQ